MSSAVCGDVGCEDFERLLFGSTCSCCSSANPKGIAHALIHQSSVLKILCNPINLSGQPETHMPETHTLENHMHNICMYVHHLNRSLINSLALISLAIVMCKVGACIMTSLTIKKQANHIFLGVRNSTVLSYLV